MGSGFAAAFHLNALRRVYGVTVDVSGIYSPTKESRERFAAEHGLTAYDSPDAVIERADVVHICTPPATHEVLAITALDADRDAVVEKPYTGYFGGGDLDGDTFSREAGLRTAMESVRRIGAAEATSRGRVLYAENWVYAPAIQKEREIIEKTGAQILWMHGLQAHSGSHSPTYGVWQHSGGGSVMGKAVHPLTAALYLKRVEGRTGSGRAIRPRSVSARVHSITRLPAYRDTGFLRTGYTDVEDFGALHVVFDDGTVADIFANELVHGGVSNRLEVHADNHRTICNINPNTAMQTYNPREEQFADIYVVEKTGTKQGWAFTSPDEDWFTGYQHEMEAFYRAASTGEPVESDSALGADTVAVVYGAYLSAERRGEEVAVPS